MKWHRRSSLVVIGSLLILIGAAAADWPQWRGPARDGTTVDLRAPAVWPDKLTRIWSVPVGEGHASPIVVGDRVFLHSREADQEVVRALRLADGGLLWRQSWPAPYEMHPAARQHGPGPKSTPVAAGGALFTLGISGGLTALDQETGRVLWRQEFSSQFKKTSPLYGTASSPMVERGMVIAHVGGHHEGALTAFDVKTGEARWSLKGDGPGYASPIAADLGGVRQIVTQTDQRIVGVAVDDGRLLWSLPLTTPYDQNAVTPLVLNGRLIVSGLEYGLRSFAIESKGGQLAPREIWSRREASLYLSSPVAAAGRIVGFSHLNGGQFVCVDPETGRVLWSGPGRQADNAALVGSGDIVLALIDSGDLIAIAAASDAYVARARYKVAESATWAHPAPTAKGLLVKDAGSLSLWSWPS